MFRIANEHKLRAEKKAFVVDFMLFHFERRVLPLVAAFRFSDISVKHVTTFKAAIIMRIEA